MTQNGNGNSAITGVILDYGEVICHKPAPEDVRRIEDIVGVYGSQFTKLYDRDRYAYDRGELTPERYWSAFADEPGVRLTAEQIELLRKLDVEMWSKTNPVMLDWLRSLRRAGLKTGLLSNMHPDMVAKARRDFDWISDFDYAVLSAELRLAKPETRIYEYCLEKLGTEASKTIFIDDREPNLRGAENAGLRTLHFQSVSQLRAELKEIGFPVLPNSNNE